MSKAMFVLLMALLLCSVQPVRALELEDAQISALQEYIMKRGGVADFPTLHLFAYLLESDTIVLVTVTPLDLDKQTTSRCTATILVPLASDDKKLYLVLSCGDKLSDADLDRLTNEMADRAKGVVQDVIQAMGQRI